MDTRLSLVVPMFNEAARLESGVGIILAHLARHYRDAEVILVDDGSVDETAVRAEQILARYPALRGRVLRMPTNCGKGAAVRAGMLAARGSVRAFADADNATPIEQIDRLLPLLRSPRTIVIGSRGLASANLERRQPWWRESMGRSFNLLLRCILGLPFHDTQCGFKIFGQEAAEICFARQTLAGFAFDAEILAIAQMEGFEVIEVPVQWRHVPESRVRALRDSVRMARDIWTVRLRQRRAARSGYRCGGRARQNAQRRTER